MNIVIKTRYYKKTTTNTQVNPEKSPKETKLKSLDQQKQPQQAKMLICRKAHENKSKLDKVQWITICGLELTTYTMISCLTRLPDGISLGISLGES